MSIFNKIAWGIGVLSIPAIIFFGSVSSRDCGLMLDSEHRELLDGLNDLTKYQLKTLRSVGADDLCQIPLKSLKKSLRKILSPRPDHPGEARSFRHQQQLDEKQQFNIENWHKAHEQAKEMREIQKLKSAQNREKLGGGIDPGVWESIGPGNIGGRIRSLAFDPDDSTRIYAGAVSGGVWLTEDAGASWTATDDFMANLSISSIIFDPTDSNTIYAGTGEGTFNIDNIRGLGIFKSIDKGASWSSLTNTANDFDFYWVNRLSILSDASRVLAATHTGVWISNDAGVNWASAYSGRSNDVDVDPTDDLKAIAGTWTGALYSTDGGQTWTAATGMSFSNNRVEVAYAKSVPDTVYASVDNNSGEVYKSIDGGQSYILVNTGNSYLGGQGWYDNAIWVDPTNPDHLIVGGIDLWRSTDGGVTLDKISTWYQTGSVHADHHFVIEHPAYDAVTNKQVYFANDGGVYTAEDIEIALNDVGWQALNNSLAITQFYGFDVAPNGTVVGGTQDNGTLVYKGDSEGWTETFGGDGGFSAADPTDSNYLYGEYVNLQIHRSTNGGIFSSSISNGLDRSGANFIAPFILDPNNENRMLAGADQLLVSDNVKDTAPTWISIKPEIGSSSPISAITVEPSNSDVIYVGHNDGSLYKTSDGTQATPTWELIGDAQLPQRYLMRIAIDPLNSQIIYVSFGGYSSNNLWKSVDGGVNWSDFSGTGITSIPSAPIRSIVVHPSVTNQLYVGTEVGIFTSEDSGATWNATNDGPANVSVDELHWDGNETLYAATHGRGVFRADLNPTTPNTIIFDSIDNAALSTEYTTAEKTISGLGTSVDVTITGGEYSLGCNGTFTSAAGTANNDDTICLRHTSSADHYTTTLTQITIGSSTFNFESRTIQDTVPDDFSFDAISDTELSSVQTSNAITVAGISVQTTVSVVNGEYSIGCTNDFVANAGTILLGESVCVRHTSSDQTFVTTSTTLTMGGVSADFESTTLPDVTPDAFSFSAVDDVPINSTEQSETISPEGFQVAIPISITNGEYSINCASEGFTSVTGEIAPTETVCVRHTTSSDYLTQAETILDINGVTANFVSTTMPDRTPDDFSFASVSGAELGVEQVSETVTITGLAVDVDISVSGGEYSIGCASTFTSVAATISEGDTLCVRHTSSAAFSTQTQTDVTVGTNTVSFVSTTKAAPPPPEPSSSGGGGSFSWWFIFGIGMLIGFGRKNRQVIFLS